MGKFLAIPLYTPPQMNLKTYLSPYAVAIIELEEGAKITSQIVDCNIDDMK
jgi:uncharacterized OB-fold protein